jgi:hypothetical protein
VLTGLLVCDGHHEEPAHTIRSRGGTGLVERVTYHNAENGFCVVRIKARGHRELVTLVGHAAAISAGEWVTASGNWINDRTQSAVQSPVPQNLRASGRLAC